ncbi:MAG: exodeoxyribonuclease VII large subunit [Pseudomonadales bacterium]|nr:exodeoxyribonuclease VII large subunit [Pseudomonadales bacterium]
MKSFDLAGDQTPILTVSELNQQARDCLENNFAGIEVEGEISDLLQHRSGHWYFTLKDEQSQLRCAMFKFQNKAVRFQPEDGQQVRLKGKLSLYAPRGSYQFIVERMQPAGSGQLQQAFDALKIRLAKQGWFDTENKQTLPSLAKQVVIITSPQGAAIRDMQTTFARRFAGIRLVVIPVPVQGDGAAEAIAEAIIKANQWAKTSDQNKPLLTVGRQQEVLTPEAIIIGRGGGSLEDLWAFNELVVAQAIHESELPIVSAVGHETDTTIADLVADIRAATPTAAAELLSPDNAALQRQLANLSDQLKRQLNYCLNHAQNMLKGLARRVKHPSHQLNQQVQKVDQLDNQLFRSMNLALTNKTQQLEQLQQRLMLSSPTETIQQQQLDTHNLQHRLSRAMKNSLYNRQLEWRRLIETLHVVSPLATLNRGYSIVTATSGDILRSHTSVTKGDEINAKLADGDLQCVVVSSTEQKQKSP